MLREFLSTVLSGLHCHRVAMIAFREQRSLCEDRTRALQGWAKPPVGWRTRCLGATPCPDGVPWVELAHDVGNVSESAGKYVT
jgi:hypothetical protein